MNADNLYRHADSSSPYTWDGELLLESCRVFSNKVNKGVPKVDALLVSGKDGVMATVTVTEQMVALVDMKVRPWAGQQVSM